MKQFKMIVSSRTRIFDCEEGPFWIEFTVDQSLVFRLQQMAEVCTEFDLVRVEFLMYPDHWENEDEYRLSGHSLCVLSNMFYFKAYHKHSYGVVESDLVHISEIVDFAEHNKEHHDNYRWLNGVLYYSDNLDSLIETVTGSLHENSV